MYVCLYSHVRMGACTRASGVCTLTRYLTQVCAFHATEQNIANNIGQYATHTHGQRLHSAAKSIMRKTLQRSVCVQAYQDKDAQQNAVDQKPCQVARAE